MPTGIDMVANAVAQNEGISPTIYELGEFRKALEIGGPLLGPLDQGRDHSSQDWTAPDGPDGKLQDRIDHENAPVCDELFLLAVILDPEFLRNRECA